MDYSNYHGGGTRGSSPSRRSLKKTANENEDDMESRSSEPPSNCFGFVAYSVNPGEKSRVKIKTLNHQSAYPGAFRCDPDRALTPSRSPSPSGCSIPSPCPVPSPSPTPSPLKPRSVHQRERDKEDRHERHSKKRRAKESNPPYDPLDLLWMG